MCGRSIPGINEVVNMNDVAQQVDIIEQELIKCEGCHLIDPARINAFDRAGKLKKPKPPKPRQKREGGTSRPRRQKKKDDPNQTLWEAAVAWLEMVNPREATA